VPFGWNGGAVSGLLASGSDEGIIFNAFVRFKSHKFTGDVHSDMNYKNNFEKCLTESLIPDVAPFSIW
jgi:hypothetical protein